MVINCKNIIVESKKKCKICGRNTFKGDIIIMKNSICNSCINKIISCDVNDDVYEDIKDKVKSLWSINT